MHSLLFVTLVLFAVVDARAEPTSTFDGMWRLPGACAQSLGGPAALAGSEVTPLFSIKRDGSLQGKPRITHSKLVGDEEAHKAFLSEAVASVARCFPLPITEGLGGAVAGRPLRIYVINRPKEQGV